MTIPEDFVFADCEPLIIEVGNNKWIHPFIKDWYKPNEDGYDNDMYRVYFDNDKGETLYIYFKSSYLTEKTDAYFAQEDWEDKPKQALFADPFIDSKLVYEGLKLTLLEDCWGPMPPAGTPFHINEEYEKWIETGLESNQFCFSEFGEIVNAFFSYNAVPSFFSLDCGLTTEDGEWWCDS